jgi:NADPH-dependent 2,4-dienoyl-CoA reductase/sulfur reductase-like enzyme/peroxiredoxin family protein/TusA-related sulfurtransferase/rhodanese-related sulfurtransferase
MKIIIIGGVAGGATTAARLRRRDEKAEIVMYEKGQYISYANCGLPYYIGDTISERDRLFVQTPESFHGILNVNVKTEQEVLSINKEKKTVTVKNLVTGQTFEDNYDKLVLSPGAEPIKPPIPGIDSPRIYTMRNVPDTDAIKTAVEEGKPRRAVVIGAGFIGLEMAENLHEKGIFVTVVEAVDQVMSILDYEMAAEVHAQLKLKGVELYLSDGVTKFEDEADSVKLTLQSGKVLEADMVILSIGVKPDTKLATEAGLEVGKAGGIWVNDKMQTSDPDIFALGDAIEFPSPLTGHSLRIPLAGPANKQGRIVADNIINAVSGKELGSFKGTIGTGIAKVFDLTVASSGLSEKQLDRLGVKDVQSLIIHGSSHAGYYPDAHPLTLKIVYNKEGKLYGAQAVGYDGVDKRIDIIAALLGMGGTVYDLQEVEHAYAPPFSSAKDPVNIAGFTAENILAGRSAHITWKELRDLPEEERFILDVRTTDEFGLGTISGAYNIPQPEVRSRLGEIPRDRKVVLLCGVGKRAYMVERILRQEGFDTAILSGGLKVYSAANAVQSNENIWENQQVIHPLKAGESQNESLPLSIEVKTIEVDACGLQCPGPVLKLKKEIDKLNPGEMLREIATDPGFAKDVYAWAKMTGNQVLSVEQQGPKVTALVQKGKPKEAVNLASPSASLPQDGTSMVVFSDDLDKALASFVIANGAAASGKKVTLFFTFWGLSVIKKHRHGRVKKDFMGKMFTLMLPKHSKKLGLSKMNMGGMGSAMMRARMKAQGVDSLEQMIQSAVEGGVKLIACQMSMDVMGVKREELMDCVEIGGVATFLQSTDDAQSTIFI